MIKKIREKYKNQKRLNKIFSVICFIFLLTSSNFAQKAEILKKCEADYNVKNYESLIVNCNQYLQLDTLNPRIYFLRGYAFKERENSDKDVSIADFEKCLFLDPLNTEAFYLCKVLKDMRWYFDDWEYYEVIKLDSNYYLPYFHLACKKIDSYGLLLEPEMLDSVEILLNRALDLKPNEHEIILKRAEYYLIIKEYKLAQKDFNQAITINSSDINAYKGRGEALYFLNQFTLAISDLTKYINYETNRLIKIVGNTNLIDPNVFLIRGNSYAKIGNRTLALVDYNRVSSMVVNKKRIQWIYNNNKCVDRWSLILENQSEMIINQITFNLIITNEEDDVIFKKQYTLDIKIAPGEIAPIDSFPVGGELCYTSREMENFSFEFILEKIK